jgi:hypothetical protein
MAETQAWRDSRICRARGEASAAAGAAGRAAGRGSALWSLLHAQALLDGGVGAPYDDDVVEDDRRRLGWALGEVTPASRNPARPVCPGRPRPPGRPCAIGPTGWAADQGDEKQCSRSVSAGRGSGASAPGMRPSRPTRGTPMWSGPRRSPVPVIAPAEEQPGSHVPPSPPRRRTDRPPHPLNVRNPDVHPSPRHHSDHLWRARRP